MSSTIYIRPHRLEAKDASFSGWKRRFEFFWGHHFFSEVKVQQLRISHAFIHRAPRQAFQAFFAIHQAELWYRGVENRFLSNATRAE